MTRALPYRPTLTPRSPSTQRPFPTPVLLGGHGQTVLVFSTDAGGFSLVRLASLLREYVSGKYALAAADRWGEVYTSAQRAGWLGIRHEVEMVVRDALGRIRLCRIDRPDGWALATALGRIEDVVLTELGEKDELGLVCVDGFGAAFWPDAFAARNTVAGATAPTASTANVPGGTAGPAKRLASALAQSPMYHALDALTHVRQTFSPLVVLTTQLLPGGGVAGRTTTHLPYPFTHPFPAPRSSTALPPVYPRPPPDGLRPITHLITLEQVTPRPLGGMQRALEAIRREEDRRAAEEQKLVVRGRLRVVGDAGREAAWEGRVGGRGLQA